MGEVEPGMPWGRLVDGKSQDVPVETRTGGFGDSPTFSCTISFLRSG